MKVFNKQIPAVFVLAILALSVIGGATLVNYLSNKVTAEITVESPMVTSISEGKDSWATAQCKRTSQEPIGWVDCFPEGDANSIVWSDTISISDAHGGESVTLYTMSANIANAEITGFEEAIVTNTLGVTCEDFESIIVRVDSIYGDLGYGTPKDAIGLGACFVIDVNSVRIGSPDDSTWGAGETDVSEIVVTFEEAASGTYTFSYQVIPEV